MWSERYVLPFLLQIQRQPGISGACCRLRNVPVPYILLPVQLRFLPVFLRCLFRDWYIPALHLSGWSTDRHPHLLQVFRQSGLFQWLRWRLLSDYPVPVQGFRLHRQRLRPDQHPEVRWLHPVPRSSQDAERKRLVGILFRLLRSHNFLFYALRWLLLRSCNVRELWLVYRKPRHKDLR